MKTLALPEEWRARWGKNGELDGNKDYVVRKPKS